MKVIETWSQVPDFGSKEEESKFWLEHSLSGQLLANSRHHTDGKESTTITLRFDPRMLSRIKRMARSRYLNYQSMIKQWLSERLEDEIRRAESGTPEAPADMPDAPADTPDAK